MKVFSDSVAVAWPTSPQDIDASVRALASARIGQIPVEVRIGVGALHGEVPLRVLGYAGCVAETLQRDVRTLIEPATPIIALFSSAPKVGEFHPDLALKSLVALGGALRLAQVSYPIEIDIAANHPEIPIDLDVELPPDLVEWLTERALRHRPDESPSFQYAFEHASTSMFGDIVEMKDTPFRITIGGATEAKFWAVRMNVRTAASARGACLAPVAGIIMRSLRVPWYQPLTYEPPLASARMPEVATAMLTRAANPARDGNPALKREARATARLITHDNLPDLLDAVGSAQAAMRFARDNGISIGTRLVQAIGDVG